ncbi:glycosyltransferase family 39 protein [Ramicandelaber brevisporus]|nr:glycosyltransferase family 39 protein [Ramicandelaber brevisporus]
MTHLETAVIDIGDSVLRHRGVPSSSMTNQDHDDHDHDHDHDQQQRQHLQHQDAENDDDDDSHDQKHRNTGILLLEQRARERKHRLEMLDAASRDEWRDWITVGVLTLIACFTHFYKIGAAAHRVWDESHFVKFGSYYIKGTFYHDVHPPLAKILVAFSGVLARYDGSIDFDGPIEYPANVDYTTMRVFNAVFGILRVPLAYFTANELGFSKYGSLLAASFVLFDNALTTISRFVLLDSILLFFTALSFFCMVRFHNEERLQPFSIDWWLWLFMTGLSLGCVLSSKWVGLFVYALVGLYTVWRLYSALTVKKINWWKYLGHWAARIVMLIVLPIAIYMLMFKVHFMILTRSGPGDSAMSSLFQASLEGSELRKIPLNVAYGSAVTIRANTNGGGLLHSHKHNYPEGSKQQQITAYGHKDENNVWIFMKPHGTAAAASASASASASDEQIELVKNGDIVRLVHNVTRVNLHSHYFQAPRTKDHNEVSGYGSDESLPDDSDHWRIEIIRDEVDSSTPSIRALLTKFRLVHTATGCYLRSVGHSLPDWGFSQDEVYCEKNGSPSSRGNIWNVESNIDPRQPIAEPSAFRTKFFRDLVDVNAAMWSTNSGLIPDRDKIDILASEPLEWPFMTLGMRMNGWDDDRIKFYLLGNPFVWITSTVLTLAFPLVVLAVVVRVQRGLNDWRPSEYDQFMFAGFTLFGGWFLHYIPFFIMGRVTYLHHYFPAVYFSMILAAHIIDHTARRLFGGRMHTKMMIVLAIAAMVVFWFFRHITFGMPFPAKEMSARRWKSSWNLYD